MKEKILHASFNQDCSCLAIGTDSSFKIYSVDPFRKCFEHEGGMNCVQMLYSTSLLGLVGAGQQASLSPRRLQLFNTSEQKMICEFNFVSSILNVLMTRKRLVVVLECRIHLFDISTMKILRTIETSSNKKGICALIEHGSDETNNYVSYLAYPYGTNMISTTTIQNASSSSHASTLGTSPTTAMTLAHGGGGGAGMGSSGGSSGNMLNSSNSSGSLLSSSPTFMMNDSMASASNNMPSNSSRSNNNNSQLLGDIVIMDAITGMPLNAIRAHRGKLSTIQFNRDGTLLATASEKGTVIRVFSVLNSSQLCTLRRGSYAATIYSMAFSADSSMLSVSSDKGTVHVFKLTKGGGAYYAGPSNNNNNNNSSSTNSEYGGGVGGGGGGTSSDANSSDLLSSSPSASELLMAADQHSRRKQQQIGTLSDTLGNLWDSVRDFAHAKVKFVNSSVDSRNICGIAAGSHSTLLVVTYDGFLHKYVIDLVNGGEAKLESSQSLFQ